MTNKRTALKFLEVSTVEKGDANKAFTPAYLST